MRGCVRASERSQRLACAAALLALSVAACSPTVLTVVDPKAPLLDGLVGWWRFDEGPGASVVHDASGHGNDATVRDLDTSSPLYWPPGIAGKSLDVGGAGYLLVPESDTIDAIVDQVTVVAWVYLEGDIQNDYGTAISRAIGTDLTQHYHLSLNGNERPNLFITVESGAGAIPNGPTNASRFAWTFMAGTYDGANAYLYVGDSAMEQLVDFLPIKGPFAQDTTPLILGGNQNGDLGVTERFPGRIDEVMLYKRALSADEIHMLFTGALFSSSAAPGP
jgi:hypothetical protein